MPEYARKENGCFGYCAFADFTEGGNLEVVNERRVVSNMAGAELRPASGDNAYQVVSDVTGNGWPDIVQPANGGYWRHDGGTLTWVDVPAFSGGRSMQILLADFDNDGDCDLFLLDGPKVRHSPPGVLSRNNGSGGLTDVSVG